MKEGGGGGRRIKEGDKGKSNPRIGDEHAADLARELAGHRHLEVDNQGRTVGHLPVAEVVILA